MNKYKWYTEAYYKRKKENDLVMANFKIKKKQWAIKGQIMDASNLEWLVEPNDHWNGTETKRVTCHY